jgi:hypothetical protein
MSTSRRAFTSAIFMGLLVAGCAASRRPTETTPDGLVRVPSRGSGGVFREPGWPFAQYKRLIVEPLTVEFVKDWLKQHPEVSRKEVKRLEDEAAKIFREQFERELIATGRYGFANEPEPDVLIVSPRMTDLDVPGPESDTVAMRTLSPRSVGLRLTGELRDAPSGRLIGRVDMFAPPEEYGMHELRPANRSSTAHEIQKAIREWAQLLREALDVAKNEKKDSKLE